MILTTISNAFTYPLTDILLLDLYSQETVQQPSPSFTWPPQLRKQKWFREVG